MATQPVENLEAVLGRFQAWTGARAATETNRGVRELSDEEALASGRYRWKSAGGSPMKKPVALSEPAGDRGKTASVKARNPKHRSAKKAGGGHSGAPQASPAKSSAKSKEEAQPAFREVFTKAVRPAAVVVTAQRVEISRQVAISIRLAPAERALIKTRAAESGITASAYIRQCALEVDQLREQVRAAVSAMEHGGHAAPATAVTGSFQAGFFARLARRFFSRRSPALALRA